MSAKQLERWMTQGKYGVNAATVKKSCEGKARRLNCWWTVITHQAGAESDKSRCKRPGNIPATGSRTFRQGSTSTKKMGQGSRCDKDEEKRRRRRETQCSCLRQDRAKSPAMDEDGCWLILVRDKEKRSGKSRCEMCQEKTEVVCDVLFEKRVSTEGEIERQRQRDGQIESWRKSVESGRVVEEEGRGGDINKSTKIVSVWCEEENEILKIERQEKEGEEGKEVWDRSGRWEARWF